MKIGLMVFLANDRENNRKRPYETIRAIAQQADVTLGGASVGVLLFRSQAPKIAEQLDALAGEAAALGPRPPRWQCRDARSRTASPRTPR